MAIIPQQQVQSQRRLAEALLQQGSSTAPVQSPLEGLARALTAGVGGYFAGKANKADAEGRSADMALLAELLGGKAQGQEVDASKLGGFYNQDLATTLAPQLFAPAKPPETREINRGGEIVTQQWNPQAGTFEDIGAAPRWQSRMLSPEELEQQMALRQAGRSNTTVTVDSPQYGTIPAGFQMVKDPETGAVRMEPVPGSPAAMEQAAAAEQKAEARDRKEQGAGVVIQDIDRSLDLLKTSTLPVAGIGGSILQNVPGTAAHDVSNLLESVRAASAFERLQQMREASPTGGALGQVTERELALLQNAVGSLSQSQTTEQFADNLRRVRNLFLDVIHGPGAGPERSPLGFEQEQPASGSGTDLTPDEQDILRLYGVP